MKRCIALLIGLLLLCNTFGFYLVYKGMLHLHKKEMKALLKSNTEHEFVEIIKIPAGGEALAGLVFIEPHEFTYQNQMYDIVKTIVINDTTYYYCINDVKETRLKEQIRLQHQRQSSTSSAYFLKLLHLLTNIALEGQMPDFKIFNYHVLQQGQLVQQLLIIFHKPLSPPPKECNLGNC